MSERAGAARRSAEESWTDTLRRLRDAQKPPHGTAAYSRFVNRPLGRLAAVAGYQLNLTPNAVSFISIGLTAVGIILIAAAPPHPVTSILAAALLVLGYAVDSADGQVARLTGRSSKRGEWLDHMLDSAKEQCIHVAVLVHMFRWFDDWPVVVLCLPIIFGIVANVLYFGLMLIDQLRRAQGGSGNRPGPNSLSVIRALALLPIDFGALAVVLGLLYWQGLFVWLYTLLLTGTMALFAAALRKWWIELGEAEPTGPSGPLVPSP